MTASEFVAHLSSASKAEDFAQAFEKFGENVVDSDFGEEILEPVFRFIEEHPDIYYGMPGPLTHFLEDRNARFANAFPKGLVDSVVRRPTQATIEMIVRTINGQAGVENKKQYLDILKNTVDHPAVDGELKHFINDMCDFYRQIGLMAE